MGLRRHQIENLVLRGPVFYWRARIPVRFAATTGNSRLSLSLRLSDRKKASVVARRLNALLLQLELMPMARMATKEQLTKIFALEIDAIRDEIEALDRSAKRRGTLRDPEHREADRQVGWAYRLLHAYGTARELSFEDGSEVHAALLEAGAEPDDIPFIASTYRSERQGALSDREGRTRSPFLRDVLHRMGQVGLDDTALNRDAASEEIYRARADALLASAVDPRKPKLSGGAQEPKRAPTDAIPVTPPPKPGVLWTADPEDATAVPIVAVRHVAPSILPASAATASEPAELLNPAPALAVASGKSKARKDLPLSGFDEQLDELVANNQDQWEEDTASDVRVLVGIFRGILEEHGVTHSGEITQEHVAALRQHFNHILQHWGRSPRLRKLSPQQLREESRRVADDAEKDGKTIRLGLKPATIRRHLGNLDHFLKHLRSSHFMVPEWTFEGLRPRKPPKGEVRLQQVKPGPDDVRPVFDMPIFKGRKSAEKPDVPGDLVFHGSLYFLPMLYSYLGPRRNEFAGLMVDEVVERDGHWAIQIKANEVRRIKNAQSHRLLPLPNELLRLNFIEYVQRLKELGHKLLFPELYSPYLKHNNPGDHFCYDLRGVTMHALRKALPLMRKPATGADLYARFSRDGPPHDLALNPPVEEPYQAPDWEEVLSPRGNRKSVRLEQRAATCRQNRCRPE